MDMATKRSTKKTKKKPARPSPSLVAKKPSARAGQHARRVYKDLVQLYPQAHCALNHRNAYELLVATILSAQCTDVRVNRVTPDLFKKYPKPTDMARAPVGDIERAVRSTGFYRNKAKSLKAASRMIVDEHGGRVPDTMEKLVRLPGVARKTANVVLGNAYDRNEGVVVDTHVGRLSRRLGLTAHTDPNKVEKDLMVLFPRSSWTMLAHLLIQHGRLVCGSRRPQCDRCSLAPQCPKYGVEAPAGSG